MRGRISPTVTPVKWIELLQKVGEHPAGKFIEVEDHIARSYCEAGLAKDGGDGPEVVQLQRAAQAFREELQNVTGEFARQFTEATDAIRRRPNLGDGIEATESEADKKSGFGDLMRSIVTNANPQADLKDRDAARDTLVKVYGCEPAGQGMWRLGSKPAQPHVVRSFNRSNPGLIQRNMTESTGTAGGYLTAVNYESMVLMIAGEEGVFAPLANRVPLGARQTEWPALDQYSAPAAGQAAWFGGVRVYRKAESAQRTVSDPAFKKVNLVANDLTAYDEFSRDLLQDSTTALDAMIPKLFGQAIGWRTDWECFNGNSLGQFTGVNNSAALVQVTRNTSSHIKYQDVFTMYSRMTPSEKAFARWYVHPFAMVDIFQLQDPGNRFIYIPNLTTPAEGGPISAAPSGKLLGVPVIESEKCAQLGSAGDLNLWVPRRYLLGERSGLEIGISEHFKWDTDQIAIRAKVRNDGKPQQVGPIYLGDGSASNTVSCFVSLL